MKEVLQFERSITNPAGIEWVVGSGADVGADLYMVAPVGSASVPSPSALYKLDPTTGEATILGALGVVDPTDIAWDKDGSMMYLIDNDSDALYTVRQIQAPSPSAPVTPGDATGLEYLPNAGDLYYNGGNFADAVMRWDNPSWTHDDDDCKEEDTDCSTYEHDLELEWDNPDSQGNPGGWFTVPSTRLPRSVENELGFSTSLPGYRFGYRDLSITVPYAPPGFPDRVYIPILLGAITVLVPVNLNPLPEDLFCTTWSDLPNPYDDCHTAGLFETRGKIVLSMGTYKANLIEAGRDYYGYWSFNNQRGADSTTEVNLYGQEGRFGEDPDASLLKRAIARTVCPRITVSKWCVFGIDGCQAMLSPYEDGSTWEWTHRTSFYDSYYRR